MTKLRWEDRDSLVQREEALPPARGHGREPVRLDNGWSARDGELTLAVGTGEVRTWRVGTGAGEVDLVVWTATSTRVGDTAWINLVDAAGQWLAQTDARVEAHDVTLLCQASGAPSAVLFDQRFDAIYGRHRAPEFSHPGKGRGNRVILIVLAAGIAAFVAVVVLVALLAG